ncbi:DUF6292 family protein [Amycolatopsis magusensis]|uniref:DUF6292 domain-containing protein n=1 Tax=Amycolatopsis magusensis TaxID=882444 RepID=A0ABS4Q2P3_9PSEU|nr:DUF6292 family protein [Amycolatopsis magusensis]MBP2185375.1 hypothetical protein [Amycolatopsis magusensis]
MLGVDFAETEVNELRRYVRMVAGALGQQGDSFYVQATPLAAYLALDGRLAAFPDRDVALIWDEQHGWALALETEGNEDPVVISRCPDGIRPAPRDVAAFAVSRLMGVPRLPDPQAAA